MQCSECGSCGFNLTTLVDDSPACVRCSNCGIRMEHLVWADEREGVVTCPGGEVQ